MLGNILERFGTKTVDIPSQCMRTSICLCSELQIANLNEDRCFVQLQE